jgi:hypothetical protein
MTRIQLSDENAKEDVQEEYYEDSKTGEKPKN